MSRRKVERLAPFPHHYCRRKMATPKGMRLIQLPVNSTDAVHVYSSDRHIWLQIRRAVPTERDIGRSSFKVALSLTPGTAHKLGLELLNLAERNKDLAERNKVKPKAKAGARQPADEKGAKSI